ncbi:hypothetical protein DL98DRAFT_612011 [Cadophora sp. DSE1049]|nr:hypothetical protein DL98DRAFT_612011 [Cadophora sp. DSE1049]
MASKLVCLCFRCRPLAPWFNYLPNKPRNLRPPLESHNTGEYVTVNRLPGKQLSKTRRTTHGRSSCGGTGWITCFADGIKTTATHAEQFSFSPNACTPHNLKCGILIASNPLPLPSTDPTQPPETKSRKKVTGPPPPNTPLFLHLRSVKNWDDEGYPFAFVKLDLSEERTVVGWVKRSGDVEGEGLGNKDGGSGLSEEERKRLVEMGKRVRRSRMGCKAGYWCLGWREASALTLWSILLLAMRLLACARNVICEIHSRMVTVGA